MTINELVEDIKKRSEELGKLIEENDTEKSIKALGTMNCDIFALETELFGEKIYEDYKNTPSSKK